MFSLALHVDVLHPSGSKISVVFTAAILNSVDITQHSHPELKTTLKSAVSIKFCDKNAIKIGKTARFCSCRRYNKLPCLHARLASKES